MLGHSSRARGETPPGAPPRALVVCLVTVPVSCLDTTAGLVLGHSSRAEGGTPTRTPPRPRPLVLGHRFCLVLGHSSRTARGQPTGSPPRAGTQIYLLIFKITEKEKIKTSKETEKNATKTKEDKRQLLGN